MDDFNDGPSLVVAETSREAHALPARLLTASDAAPLSAATHAYPLRWWRPRSARVAARSSPGRRGSPSGCLGAAADSLNYTRIATSSPMGPSFGGIWDRPAQCPSAASSPTGGVPAILHGNPEATSFGSCDRSRAHCISAHCPFRALDLSSRTARGDTRNVNDAGYRRLHLH